MTHPTPIRNPLTLEGSFSAVSKLIFASKYAFFSIKFFEIYMIHTPLHRSKFKNLANFHQFFPNFSDFFFLQKYCIFRSKSSFFAPISMDFSRNFTNFFRNCRNLQIFQFFCGIIGGNSPNYQLFL